jgi:DNA-3-methyladenine glycosylase II
MKSGLESKLALLPRPPYDFDLHWRVFSMAGPSPEIYDDGVWRRALRLSSGVVSPVEVVSRGTVDEPSLEASIPSSLEEGEREEVGDRLSWIFNLDMDLTEPYALMDEDSVLKVLKGRLYGLKPSKYSSVFEGVIKSIAQQQISLPISMRIISRIIERFGDRVTVEGEEFYEFPSPTSLAKASLEELRGCGLSQQKARYIKGFSQEVAGGSFDPEGLKDLSGEEVVERLIGFKGIGRWTAELVVVTSTDGEALPADDLGARRVLSNYYFSGRMISGDEARDFAERWGRFRGIVVYYLICAERLKAWMGEAMSRPRDV